MSTPSDCASTVMFFALICEYDRSYSLIFDVGNHVSTRVVHLYLMDPSMYIK
jgi:hypothetical protein